MTYVLGVVSDKLEMSAIFCDTKCGEWDDMEPREAPALKSGQLFSGCIYGASGDAEHIIAFVDECRNIFGGNRSPAQVWAHFETAIKIYNFAGKDDFQLILSTNESGKPVLYNLDPRDEERLFKFEPNCDETDEYHMAFSMTSIGSGCRLLNDGLKEAMSNEQQSALGRVQSKDFPYFICSWLMQKARGVDALELAKHGVGGYFHFWTQTATETKPQEVALYSVVVPISDTLHTYFYRIGYLQNGKVLVLERLSERQTHILLDPHHKSLEAVKRTAVSQEVHQIGETCKRVSQYYSNNPYTKTLQKKFNNLPFYYFCSVMFSDANLPFRLNHFRKTKGKWLFKFSHGKEFMHGVTSGYAAEFISSPLSLSDSHIREAFSELCAGFGAISAQQRRSLQLTFVDDVLDKVS